jgi:hypothetical protein
MAIRRRSRPETSPNKTQFEEGSALRWHAACFLLFMEILTIFVVALVANLLGETPPLKALFNRLENAARRAAVSVEFERHDGKSPN